MKRLSAVSCQLSALLALGGCSMIPYYSQVKVIADGAIVAAEQDRMEYNDKKADAISKVACDISIGAFSRLPEGNIKQGFALLCGLPGTPAAPIMVVTQGADGQPDVRIVSAAPAGQPAELLP